MINYCQGRPYEISLDFKSKLKRIIIEMHKKREASVSDLDKERFES